MVTVELNGRSVTRNISWFKKVNVKKLNDHNDIQVYFEPSEDEESDKDQVHYTVNNERPKRRHKMPSHFRDYITT